MDFKLEVDVKFEIIYNSAKDEFSIISCNPSISKKIEINTKKTIKHKLTKTQVKFGILTLGSRNDVGQNIPLGKTIELVVNDDKPIKITTHKTIKGRIDGLTKTYSKHPELVENTEIEVSFDVNNLILTIKTEGNN